MAGPFRLRLTPEKTSVVEGRAVVSTVRVECVLASPWVGWAFAFTSPVGVTYRGPSGVQHRMIIDSVLATSALLVAALTALAWTSRRRKSEHSPKERNDDFGN